MFHGTYQGEDENVDYYVEPKKYNLKSNQSNTLIGIKDPGMSLMR
jgi:hypothetical protein